MKVRNKCVLIFIAIFCGILSVEGCNPSLYYAQEYSYKSFKTETVAKYNYDNLCAD